MLHRPFVVSLAAIMGIAVTSAAQPQPPPPAPAQPPVQPAPAQPVPVQPAPPPEGQPPEGQPPEGQPPEGQPPPEPPPPVQPAPPPPAPPPQQPAYPPYGYGYAPPPPPPPVEKPPKECCLWSLRYDPFDLILRRVTLEAEVAWGDLPFSAEIAPSYIFDSTIDEIDEQGFDIAARIAWYIYPGDALKGFWLKAHFNFEYFESTLYNEIAEEQYAGTPHPDHCDADSEPGTCKRNVNTAVLGLMLGASMVFPGTGGFALTGGMGLGGALAEEKRLEVQGNATVPGRFYTYYDEFGKRLKLLGTLSLGITF